MTIHHRFPQIGFPMPPVAGGPFFARPGPNDPIGGGGIGGSTTGTVIASAAELLPTLRRFSWTPGRSVVIGSGEDCDVVWTNPALRAAHARIHFSGTAYSLEPIGDAEVLHDGQPVRGRCSLAFGMQLQFGPCRGNCVTWEHPHRPATTGAAGRHGTYVMDATSVVDVAVLKREAALAGADRFAEAPPQMGRAGRTQFLGATSLPATAAPLPAIGVLQDAQEMISARHFEGGRLGSPRQVTTDKLRRMLAPLGRLEAVGIAGGGEGTFVTRDAAGLTMRGTNQRKIVRNEDGLLHLRLYPRDPAQAPIGLDVVADGVGGATNGHLAARIALATLADHLNRQYDDRDASDLDAMVMDGMEAGHAAILRERGTGPMLATTMVVAIVQENRIEFVWAGDSHGFAVDAAIGRWGFGTTLASGGAAVLTTPHTLAVENAWLTTEAEWIRAGWEMENGQKLHTSLGGQFARGRIGRLTHRVSALGGVIGVASDGLLLDNAGLGNVRRKLRTAPDRQLAAIIDIATPITQAMQHPSCTLNRLTATGARVLRGPAKPDNVTMILRRIAPAAERARWAQEGERRFLTEVDARAPAISNTVRQQFVVHAHPERFANAIEAAEQEQDPARLLARLQLIGVVQQ